MKPIEAFLEIFGDVTVSQIVIWGLAILFIIKAGKEISKWFDEKHRREEEKLKLEIDKDNRDKQRDADIKKCLEETAKYPEYRKQSLEIQDKLTTELRGLRDRIDEIEEINKKREQSKLRNTLLQHYRHYTNPETNPSMVWTKLESDTFWALANEYEATGGNGEMHNEVFPAMRKLRIVDEK